VSSAKGNVGEHLVMAELLYRGFDAYWADRGNPAFDISCHWNASGRATRLRVKTTSNHSAVWTVKKKSGAIFLDRQPKDDFTVIVDLGRSLRDRDVYIVDTNELEEGLEADHDFYVSHPKKDGSARKVEQGMRCIRFFGADKPTDHGWGYQAKFAKYLEAWNLLK